MNDIPLNIKHPYLKYALFIFIGVAIAISLIIGANEYNQIQEDAIESEKNNVKESFERQIHIKEDQLELISSGIRAFYQGSEEVTNTEFELFLKEILVRHPDVANVFVTQNGKIIQAYHDDQYRNKQFDEVFSEHLSSDTENQLIFEFPLIEPSQKTLVIVPFSYFVNEEAVFSDNNQIKIVDSNNTERVLYGISQINGKLSNSVDFTPDENQILRVNHITGILDYKTQENFEISAEIWDQSFDRELRQDLFSYLTLAGLSIFAVLLPILLIRSERYSIKVALNSIELEKANKELSSIDKEKDEFSAMITHELKTPLVPIIGHTKMLSKKGMIGTLTDEQFESVKIIEKNAKRLEKLISDIMDARKLELDRMKFDKDEVSIDEFLSSLKSSLQNALNDQDIEFIIKNDTKDVIITTDESRLFQVFDNLINNAIKFVPKPHGKITVGATLEEGLVKFYVKDNGIGIPAEKQVLLFHKFYQADTSRTRKIQGTGLGLVICKGIIEKLGGKIWVESDGKTGSTFYFQLPAYA